MSQVDGGGSTTPAGGAPPADAGAGVNDNAAAVGAVDNGQESNPTGGSLLTREDGDGDGGGESGADGEKDKASGKKTGKEGADPAALIPAKPEGYDLKFGEGVSVDEPLLKGFKEQAHALGISQGQAQKLADFYARHAGDTAAAMQKAQVAALTEAKKGWEAEITSRPGFRQEVADARRTLKEFGGEELSKLMDQSLMGSHPVFFDFVVKVGKALAEPNSRGAGNDAGKGKTLMDRMWPNMK